MKNILKNKINPLIITLLAAVIMFLAIAYTGSQMPKEEKTQAPTQNRNMDLSQSELKQASEEEQPVLSKVSVQLIKQGSYQAQVEGYGAATARFELDYTSEISGRVTWLAESFEVGRQVSKGDLLATLDDTTYQQAVSQAKSDLAVAELALLEEQREGEQARSQWQRSGLSGEPDSELVFRKPQLESAQASVENAKNSLMSAQRNLAFTKIRVPFDGVITARNIQPGAFINIGGAIASLFSTDRSDIEIPLSESQWANLPPQNGSLPLSATVYDTSTNNQWAAKVERVHQYLDTNTRQRSIVLTVKSPLDSDNKLFPGVFLKAKIKGKQLENIWELPASALSQQGEIWTVDTQGLLKKHQATTLFEQGNYIYVTPVVNSESVQVVVRPLSNFKVNTKVSPQLVAKEGA
ncbi:MAG: efflux RND transporter periplasmic adaptor subunit [Paraglaciecola sp.]|uniref:efflux RND transporter periplasmic adaptor subunit n=1 Tax=Paraglaciecola sp. TaxID=1920173 RepID=UPI003296CAEB